MCIWSSDITPSVLPWSVQIFVCKATYLLSLKMVYLLYSNKGLRQLQIHSALLTLPPPPSNKHSCCGVQAQRYLVAKHVALDKEHLCVTMQTSQCSRLATRPERAQRKETQKLKDFVEQMHLETDLYVLIIIVSS